MSLTFLTNRVISDKWSHQSMSGGHHRQSANDPGNYEWQYLFCRLSEDPNDRSQYFQYWYYDILIHKLTDNFPHRFQHINTFPILSFLSSNNIWVKWATMDINLQIEISCCLSCIVQKSLLVLKECGSGDFWIIIATLCIHCCFLQLWKRLCSELDNDAKVYGGRQIYIPFRKQTRTLCWTILFISLVLVQNLSKCNLDKGDDAKNLIGQSK